MRIVTTFRNSETAMPTSRTVASATSNSMLQMAYAPAEILTKVGVVGSNSGRLLPRSQRKSRGSRGSLLLEPISASIGLGSS
jgi:hypothetical protein